MKTTSLNLQRIAAVFAIIAAPMPVRAVDGPTPVSTWIPGADVVETALPLTTYLQPGPYNSRDVYKVFVTAVAGKDLRLVVTGAAGVTVDYFDEQRTNGLYAVFGAVDAGTTTLNFQTAPTGTATWTTVETQNLTVGPQRTMNYDTEVPIVVWWDAKGQLPGTWNTNPTAAQIETTLDTDFANLKADGFTCVNVVWLTAYNNSKSTIYSNLTQHGMKIMQSLYSANNYVLANMDYPLSAGARHNNVPLLGLESALNTDMLADVDGGAPVVELRNHPQLFSYYLIDENQSDFVRGEELEAMLAKNIDPNHGSGSSSTGLHGTSWSANILQKRFADFIVNSSYPLQSLAPASGPSDFTKNNWQAGDLGNLNVPDQMDWDQNWDLRRYQEIVVQTHSLTGRLRTPSTKELRALVMMAAARGSRPFGYFIYGWGQTTSLFGPPYGTRTATLDEAKLVNQKLAGWMPIYKDLYRDENGTKITYTQVAPSSGDLFFSGFESSESTFGATNTTGTGHIGTRYGQLPANEVVHKQNWLLPETGAPSAVDRVPRYNSCVYTVWVNDNGDANMTYRLGASFAKSDGTSYTKYSSYVNIPNTTGWHQLTLTLTPDAADLLNARFINVQIQASTPVAPVAYSVDDVKLAYTLPAYTPSYQLNGGVVGTFLHAVTGKRYIIVVNTDTTTTPTKTVVVNVIKNGGGAATTAKNVDTQQVYTLTSGNLSIPLAPGDGALLEIDSSTTLYSNNMETAPTYTSGTLVTTPVYLGSKSEQRPANGVLQGSTPKLNLALPASVSNFTYSVWVTDNNHPTQVYRIGVHFKNPTAVPVTYSSYALTPWVAAGPTWTQLSGDFTAIVNQRIGEGYTQLYQITLQAWNGSTAPRYVPYYADDVLVQYQLAMKAPLLRLAGQGTVDLVSRHRAGPVVSKQRTTNI